MNIIFSDRIKDVDNEKNFKNDWIKKDLFEFKKELIKENTNSKLQEITLEQSLFQLSQIKSEFGNDWKFSKNLINHPNAVKLVFLVQRIFAGTEFDCGIIDGVWGENTAFSIKKFNDKYIKKTNGVLGTQIVEKIIEIYGNKKVELDKVNDFKLNKVEIKSILVENNLDLKKEQEISENIKDKTQDTINRISTNENENEENFVGPPELEEFFNEKYSDLIEIYPRMTRFYNAMKRTNFFPEPQVIEYFFQMGIQESSLAWNPRIGIQESRKKKEIKEKLDDIREILNSTIGELSLIILDNEDEKNINSLISELEDIYKNEKSTEYNLYNWTKKVINFLDNLKLKYPTILKIVQLSDNFKQKIYNAEQKLKHIPNSFGIWQNNADFFLEKIKKSGVISKFPEISNLGEQQQKDELIKALCGESQILNRDRTMELIIEGHLKPRYENHNKGKIDDLKYMVVENLIGEMSTYYAKIQETLNEELKLNPPLKIDGIMGEKKKYSNEYDFEKIKKNGDTYKALEKFINENYPNLKNKSENLIKEIFEADSFEKLSKSILYVAIMGDKVGERIIGKDMGSSHQTAIQYFENIEKKKIIKPKKLDIKSEENRNLKIKVGDKLLNYEYNDLTVLEKFKEFYDKKENKFFPKKGNIILEGDKILKSDKYSDHYNDDVNKMLEENGFTVDKVITKSQVDVGLENAKIGLKEEGLEKVELTTENYITYGIGSGSFESNEKYSYLLPEAEKENRIITKMFQNKIKEFGIPENFRIFPVINSLIRDKERNDELRKQGFHTDPNSSHMHGIAFDYGFERFGVSIKKENSDDWYYLDTLDLQKDKNIQDKETIKEIQSILQVAKTLMAKIIEERHNSGAIIFTNETKTTNPHYHINVNPKYNGRKPELEKLGLKFDKQ